METNQKLVDLQDALRAHNMIIEEDTQIMDS